MAAGAGGHLGCRPTKKTINNFATGCPIDAIIGYTEVQDQQ